MFLSSRVINAKCFYICQSYKIYGNQFQKRYNKKLEQAKFINLDVPVRDIIEATNGVSSDMEYYDICPPLIRWHPPKRFGEDEVINQIKTLTENIKELNEKINGLTQR